MSEIVEYEKHNKLTVSKQGKSAWHSYKYKKQDLPLLIQDYEEQYHITAKNNHMMIVEDTKSGEIQPYLTKSGLNAIANSNQISTKIEITARKYDSPYAFEVKAIAILPNGVSHEFTAVGISTMQNKSWMSPNQLLAWTQTKARNGAITSAMEIQNCSWEELQDSPEFAKRAKTVGELEQETLQPCPACKEKGYSRLQQRCVKCGITVEEIRLQKEGN